MKLKKGVTSLGKAARAIPGVKRKEWGGQEFVFNDEHKLDIYGSGNKYYSEINLEEYRWVAQTWEDELDWMSETDYDWEHDGLWSEVQLIRLTVKR